MHGSFRIFFIGSFALAACSQPPSPGGGATGAPGAPSPAPVSATPAPAASPGKASGAWNEPFTVATEKFGDPEKAFATAKDALLTKYYAAGLTEEDVYRAAVRGMVEDVDARMHSWNKLLPPSELAEISSDLKGEIVGIGVHIKFDDATGHIAILGTVPGAPAEKAGLRANDTILSVDGQLYKGRGLRDAIAAMRGKAGNPVTLSVLRDDKILPFTIVRAPVVFDETERFIVDGVGYLDIGLFSEKTLPAVKAALGDFDAAKVHALVVDLRQNKGGSFDAAVQTAEQLVPTGATIVTLERREGKKETIASKGTPVLPNVPVVVLVDHGTSSGAELLTAALQEGRHAKTVGVRTFGKWSVQAIDELGNGYAIKYTTALFHAPNGQSYDGTGLAPDIEVDADGDTVDRCLLMPPADPAARVVADVQLRTALALLK